MEVNISKVSLLRDNKFKLIDKKPGFYRWWFKEEAAHRLIKEMKRWLPEEDKFLTMDHEGDKYIALYFGISKDMRGRIRWHASQKHTSSNINKGFLSTLRQTLSALLETPMSMSYQTINDFIDNNCIWEWSYTNTKADAEVFEKKELSKKYYYPLNVKDNNTICKNALKWLIGVRAEYRH